MPPLAGLHVVVHQAAETDLSLAEHTRLASSAAAVAAVGALGILELGLGLGLLGLA